MSRWPTRISRTGAAQNNLNATAAPKSTNDSTQGYSVGSLWVWPLGISIGYGTWICTDASVGAAVWRRIEAVNNLVAGAAPTANDDASLEFAAGSIWLWGGGGAWICEDPAIGAAVWVAVPGTVAVDLQTAYVAGNTISVTTAEGSVAISDSTDATDLLALSRTFVGAGRGALIEMGPGGQATTGIGLNVTTGAGATGAAVSIDNAGTGAALLVKDGANTVISVGASGGCVITGSNNGTVGSQVSMTGGAGVAGIGGAVAVRGGAGVGGAGAGATIQGGAGPAGFDGGSVSSLGGAGGSAATGGVATIGGGQNTAAGLAAGGATFKGGDVIASGVGACVAGDATFRGGDAASPTTGKAGDVTIRGGDQGTGGAGTGTPGALSLRAGDTLSTTGPGGIAAIRGGNAVNSSNTGGDVTVTGGASSSGKPGHTKISTPRGANNVPATVTNGAVLTLEQTGAQGATITMFAGTVDPSAGTGVTANEGSIYYRDAGTTGFVYYKYGAADTAWTLLTDAQPVSNVQAGAYALAAADIGNVVFATGAGAQAFTLPDLSAALIAGRMLLITIVCENTATAVTITPGAASQINNAGVTVPYVASAGGTISLKSRDGLSWVAR